MVVASTLNPCDCQGGKKMCGIGKSRLNNKAEMILVEFGKILHLSFRATQGTISLSTDMNEFLKISQNA